MVGMRDVARKAGVSLSSVSLVINGTGYVSAQMRARVEKAMRELDYVPNDLARHFYHDRTGLVGVIVPTIGHPFFAAFTAALQREFAARGMRTMLCSTDDAEGGEAQYVDLLRRHGVDALVVAAHTEHDAGYWTSIGRPVIAFDRDLGEGIAQVRSDHAQGGDLLADLLLESGVRRVVTVGGPRRQFDDLGRGRTTFLTVRYMTTLERRFDAAGVRHDYVESGEVGDIEGARAAVREAFDRFGDMDALIGADVVAAFGVQEALARGIDVPGHLQIVAYDGTWIADAAGLPLTAVHQDFPALAAAIGECVEAAVEGRGARDAVVPVRLRPAATTRA